MAKQPNVLRKISSQSAASGATWDDSRAWETRRIKMIADKISRNSCAGFLSPIFHFALFGLRRPIARFENGMFITSIDVDVGNEKLGVINQGRCDRNVSDCYSERFVGEVEQRNLPILLNLFEDFEIPVTFAFRGQLLDVDTYLPKLVMRSSIRHEFGSHGYYHRAFTSLSDNEANEELKMTSLAMKKLGVIPRSFVFPRNKIAHLDLLKKHGYFCYRGLGGFARDGTYITADCDVRANTRKLYDVHPSFFVGRVNGLLFTKKTVDICTRRKLPLHIWFHPLDIGVTKERAKRRIERIFSPLLRHAKRKQRVGALTFETMLSATNKTKAILGPNDGARFS